MLATIISVIKVVLEITGPVIEVDASARLIGVPIGVIVYPAHIDRFSFENDGVCNIWPLIIRIVSNMSPISGSQIRRSVG